MLAACTMLAALLPQPQQAPAPTVEVTVINPSFVERKGVLTAPLPFARGDLPLPPGVDVITATAGDGGACPAMVAFRWPDGSAALLHAQPAASVGAREETVLQLRAKVDERGVAVPWSGPAHVTVLPDPLPLRTELVDPWGRVLEARLEPDPSAGPDGVLWDTGTVRARRFSSRHRLAEADGGRPLLGLRAYLITRSGERCATLTLLLDNSAGDLGAVRFKGFALVTESDALRFLPAFAAEQALPRPEALPGGGFRQWLVRPGAAHYLGDGTAKAFAVHLFLDGPDVTEAERDAASWSPQRLCAFPSLDPLRKTGAFGAHGGPAPAEATPSGLEGVHYREWRLTARFGPFAGFGDPENSGVQGTARNGPCALHNLLRWRSPPLLQVAEGMVLQHPLRPTPGRNPAHPADMAAYRQGLGPLCQLAPHGFTAPDYEHFSVLLLYDWWWLTGDPLARDELARMGRGLRPLLSSLPFRTSRGEGWCLQSAVLIARATGDADLLAFVRRRFLEQVLPEFGGEGRSYAIRQPPHADAMGGEPFDAPWQMAALAHGLHALWRETGDERVRDVLVATGELIAGPGWIDGEGPKYFVSALDATRHTRASDPVTREGVARMVAAGLVLAAEAAGPGPRQDRLQARLQFLTRSLLPPDATPAASAAAAANPWFQVVLDRSEVPR